MAKNPTVYFYLPVFLIVFALISHKSTADGKVLGAEIENPKCKSLICKYLRNGDNVANTVNYSAFVLDTGTK